MAICAICGNDSDRSFEVHMGGETHVFDTFECAIHALASTCSHCGCRIIGHGIEVGELFFCCAHCANENSIQDVKDRI